MSDFLKFHLGPNASSDFRATFKGADVTRLFDVKRLSFELDADKNRHTRAVVKLELFAHVEIEGCEAAITIVEPPHPVDLDLSDLIDDPETLVEALRRIDAARVIPKEPAS